MSILLHRMLERWRAQWASMDLCVQSVDGLGGKACLENLRLITHPRAARIRVTPPPSPLVFWGFLSIGRGKPFRNSNFLKEKTS